MKSDSQWTVRLERQPHRDAVRRLRQAYVLLWQRVPLRSAPAETDIRAARAPGMVQEVPR